MDLRWILLLLATTYPRLAHLEEQLLVATRQPDRPNPVLYECSEIMSNFGPDWDEPPSALQE